MNIYLVISETLWEAVYEDWFNNVGHWEPFRIAELVAAKNHSQARYLAWQTDDHFSYDLRDMPRFTCRLRLKDVDEPAGIVSSREKYRHLWGQP